MLRNTYIPNKRWTRHYLMVKLDYNKLFILFVYWKADWASSVGLSARFNTLDWFSPFLSSFISIIYLNIRNKDIDTGEAPLGHVWEWRQAILYHGIHCSFGRRSPVKRAGCAGTDSVAPDVKHRPGGWDINDLVRPDAARGTGLPLLVFTADLDLLAIQLRHAVNAKRGITRCRLHQLWSEEI
ncbi:hypothetical protein CHARACLAT_024160 [Characodon lateralis]|uniref:Uncharacterized protein n=1 Tax=Characodon lateralis TaxID=208331 RepID=A0ABU7EDW6_9TELE|nr:hypothetical protein [Characodon lateralis]